MIKKKEQKLSLKEAKRQEDPAVLRNLNEAQKKAVLFADGPLLIIAGAGTGKTTVITRRVAYLLSQGIKPDQILALTFTDKAAAEMEIRVQENLAIGYYDLWISTFHAFCERVLKQSALDIGLSNDFKILDTVQQKILIRKNLHRFNLDYYKPLGNPTKFVSELVKHFSRAKDEEILPENYLSYAEKIRLNSDSPEFISSDSKIEQDEIKRINEIAAAYHVYQQLLLENNVLDFGDLINYTLKLLRNRERILNFYRDKFKHILVDEFQDTNFAQYELVKLLAAPKNNLNVVGDDDQSIYKFRGASISNIMQFKEDYPNAEQVTLTENYRSGQKILDIAYDFIQLNNPERLESKLGISKKLRSNVNFPGAAEVICGQTLSDEVDKVTQKIIEIKNSDPDLTWDDFAILVRANDQAGPFISKLGQLSVPFTFFANKGLYKKAIILDLVYYLRLLVNQHESAYLYKALNMDLFKIDPADLSAILQYAYKKTLSLREALEVAAAISPRLKSESLAKIQVLIAMLQKHSGQIAEKTVAEIFINVVRDLKVDKRIEQDTLANLENREFLEQFYRKIEQFESENADKSLKNFIELLDFELEAGEEGKLNFDPNAGPHSVKIMTAHSAKGLEYNYVFIANMVQHRFPSIDRKDAIELPPELIKEKLPAGDIHFQEERRLFYVAATRAKKGLCFSYAYDYGGAKTRKPSQFLVDIGLVAKPEKSVAILRKEQSIDRNYDTNMFLPVSFSYSQINDFRKCPLEYKYKYWLRLPLHGSAELSFGSTIHITLEKFLTMYKNNLEMTQLELFDKSAKPKLPPLQELLAIFENSWIDEWYKDKTQKQKYRERGKEILKMFYENFSKSPTTPKYLEKQFKLKIGNYTFSGKIDRADMREGWLHIIDYKTGSFKLSGRDRGNDQLYIYQWAAQEALGEKVASLSYWYLIDDTISEPIIGSEQDISELKAYLLEIIEEIRSAIANHTFLAAHKKAKDHKCEFEDLE